MEKTKACEVKTDVIYNAYISGYICGNMMPIGIACVSNVKYINSKEVTEKQYTADKCSIGGKASFTPTITFDLHKFYDQRYAGLVYGAGRRTYTNTAVDTFVDQEYTLTSDNWFSGSETAFTIDIPNLSSSGFAIKEVKDADGNILVAGTDYELVVGTCTHGIAKTFYGIKLLASVITDGYDLTLTLDYETVLAYEYSDNFSDGYDGDIKIIVDFVDTIDETNVITKEYYGYFSGDVTEMQALLDGAEPEANSMTFNINKYAENRTVHSKPFIEGTC